MRLAFALLFSLVLAPGALAADDGEDLDAVSHTGDGYYWDFSPIGKVQMPRLFVVRGADGGLGVRAYGSSKAALASGEFEAQRYGAAYAEPSPGDEGDRLIVDPDSEEIVSEAATVESDVAPYKATLVPTDGSEIVIDLSPTRHLIAALIASLLLCLLFLPMAGKYRRGVGRETAPRGLLQNLLETVIIYIRDEVARPNLGDKANRYLPYLLTVFFFILFCNLFGLLPFGATATANISTTAVLALFTFFVTQFAGTKDYWGHIFNPPGVPLALKPILIPIEFVGIFTKPFALAIRLFANLTAGHLIILNLIGLIFIITKGFGAVAGAGTGIAATLMVIFVYGLEVLVAFIQAYVFTILSALFIGIASAEHDHDHDHSEDHGLTPHDIAVAHSNGQPPHKLHERTVGTEATFA